jgi:hypothetical protein
MRAFALQARLKRAWLAMMKVGLRKRRKLEVDLLSSSKLYFEEERMWRERKGKEREGKGRERKGKGKERERKGKGKERVSLQMGRAEWAEFERVLMLKEKSANGQSF